jgi:hypothetical protein
MDGELFFTPNAVIKHIHQRDNLTSILKHAQTFGEYSIKINPNLDPDKALPPYLINYPWLLIVLSPLLASSVIFKIMFSEKLPIKFWHTLPVVKLAKIAWCFGAVKRLRE